MTDAKTEKKPGSGKAPPAPPEAAKPDAEAPAEKPKRGRPPGSKKAEPPKIDPATAKSMGEQLAGAIAIPYDVWARVEKNEAYRLSPEEKSSLANFWSFYIMLRADLFAEWMPEVMLVLVNGAPLVSRLALPKEPKPEPLKVVENGGSR